MSISGDGLVVARKLNSSGGDVVVYLLSDPDRFESEESAFFERVRATYLQLAANDPGRFVVVDATQPIDAVKAAIDAVARILLAEQNTL